MIRLVPHVGNSAAPSQPRDVTRATAGISCSPRQSADGEQGRAPSRSSGHSWSARDNSCYRYSQVSGGEPAPRLTRLGEISTELHVVEMKLDELLKMETRMANVEWEGDK